MAVAVNKSKIVQKKVGRYGSKMGGRNLEVRPVGAWVQPAILNGGAVIDAVEAAEYEEERGRRIEEEKAARLQEFQQNVKRRVQLLSQARRREQLARTSRALDLERHVMSQSSAPSEVTAPRKHHCTVRTEDGLTIVRPPAQPVLQNGRHPGILNQHRDEVHHSVSQAKRKLMAKQVIFERYDDSNKRNDNKEVDDDNRGTDNQGKDSDESLVSDEITPCSSAEALETDMDRVLVISHVDKSQDVLEEDTPIVCRGPQLSDGTSTMSGVSLVSSVYPEQRRQEEKEREQHQRAMSRRLYMDLERQQVKEKIQRQQHSIRVRELKRDVEAERRRIENLTEELVDKRPATEPSWGMSLQEQRAAAEKQRQSAQRRQKNIETSRYLEALKHNLRNKMEKQGVELPALCNCGATAWDTNPDTCANNCVFYKNPKAYTRALQCLLASCDVA